MGRKLQKHAGIQVKKSEIGGRKVRREG